MSSDIRVRSYVVGFGDCFLVSFPDGRRRRHMLIDFGNAPGRGGSNENFRAIAENIRDETGGHLDVVVMTHEHLDHMEGFYAQRAIFDRMQVDYVWMSLPSHPDYYRDYPRAEPLRRLRSRLAVFQSAMSSRGIALAPSFATLMANNLTNADRIDYVRGLPNDGSRVLYLRRGNSVAGKPFSRRVKVRVLAPERDQSVYYATRMNHLAMLARSLDSGGAIDTDDFWQFPDQRTVPSPPNLMSHDWNLLRESIQNGGTAAVRAIDKAANNTSLVFMLEVGGKRLLFPGDAEIESWEFMKTKCARHLNPVDFLKVAHHGSHNGTEDSLLDDLLPRSRKQQATIMVSTRSEVYGTTHPVPDESLLTTLKSRCRKLISTDGESRLWVDAHL